ncbi:MAG: STAS-like domain-containing protein [Patescibacteria group bacterium]|nr:STAS-like domain-containing protein [Patescibacteria group bacterium]
MNIYLKKFGTLLTSRQLGKEAFAIFKISLNKLKHGEKLIIDFEGVEVFSPSWGDEFLTPLINQYGERLVLKNTKNASVQATLDMLEKIHGYKFTIDKK